MATATLRTDQFPSVSLSNAAQAEALCAQGNTLRRAGKLHEAIATHERAVAVGGMQPKACSDLGLAYLCAGKAEQAVRAFGDALSCMPGHPELLYNLATAELHAGKAAQAVEHLQAVLAREPGRHQARFNLALAHKRLGDYTRALTLQRQVHAAVPADSEFEWGLALTEIALGDYSAGFRHLEARRRLPGYPKYARPWAGQATDQPLVVYAEQGLGDTLQFVRFLRRVTQRAPDVTLACQPSLLPLLRRAELGTVKVRALASSEARTALGAPLMSLPHLIGIQDEDLAPAPYLTAEPDLSARFAGEFWQQDRRPLVGIFYQGNPKYRADRERSMPLSALAPLLARREFRFASFQKGPGHDQLLRIPAGLRPLDLGALDTDDAAFYETAAALRAVSVLVTTDSAIAHLGGGLGVPVLLMLPFDPDFRWGLGGNRWYRTVEVVRQTRPGDWSGVVARVLQHLEGRFGREGEAA